MNVFFVRKTKNKNWSDAIELQMKSLDYFFNKNMINFVSLDVDLKLSSIFLIYQKIKNHLKSDEESIILVHHTLMLWLLFIIYPFLRGRFKIISFLHESEPMFSFSEKMKPSSIKTKLSNLLRGCHAYHKIPQLISDFTIVLSDMQKNTLNLKHCYRLNFLGADLSSQNVLPLNKNTIGCTKNTSANRVVLFPHNIQRPDKGFSFVQNELIEKNIKIFYPCELPHNHMRSFYELGEIVIIPSISLETYSLVLIEAMSLNKFIVTTDKLGLIQNLLDKYSLSELNSFGIFVTTVKNLSQTVLHVFDILEHNSAQSASRTLMEMEQLSPHKSAETVYKFILENAI